MADRRVGPPGLAPRGGGAPPAPMATQMRHQAPMASYAPRPVGPWRALRTPDGKHVYYHNAATNETTWTRPPDYVDPGPPRGGATFHAAVSAGVAPNAASASASLASASAASSVTQIHVPGTTWYEVTQPGKPSYFHDAATRTVVWTPPPAVLEARRRQTQPRTQNTSEKNAPRERDVPERQTTREASSATVSASRAADIDGASRPRDEKRARAASASPPRPPPTTTTLDDDDDDVEFDPDAYEEPDEGDAREDDEDVVEVGGYFVPRSALAPEEPPPATAEKEKPAAESASEKIAREFRELLAEKGVGATSRWDRKARELSNDPRFKAVRSHAERRRLFERHARDAGDAAKKNNAAKKNDFKADADERVAAARLMERRRKEDRARRERELAHANVSRLRAKNAREFAVERFKTLLAESEKKWDLAEAAPLAFEDAKEILFADARSRAVVAGAFEEDDMRALFEAHVSNAIHARVVDVAALLDEKLVARSAKDFLEEEDDEDEDDEKEKTNPLVSFVAAQNHAPLASDPRWDRCPVEQRAAAYVRRVETLCAELNVGTVPEDVAELRDALTEARAKRLEKFETKGDGAEDGECEPEGERQRE